jgi:hypothetical protein
LGKSATYEGFDFTNALQRFNYKLGASLMSMTYQVDEDRSIIEVRIHRPIPVEEQQEVLAEIISDASNHAISKWLFVVNTTQQQDSSKARRFTEFVFFELNKYIRKLAVVCDPALRSRVREVVAPIENQEKPVGIFSSEGEARTWLNN